MKRRLLAAVLAVLMMGSALTGCGSQTETTAAPTKEAQASTEAKTEAATTAEATTKAPETTAAPETTTEAATEPATEEVVELPMELVLPDYMVGGLPLIDEIEVEVDDLNEEEQNALERTMRAYKPGGDTLLVNNAESFYYYSQLNKDAQLLYDAMLMVAEDPTTTDRIAQAFISIDPYSSDFWELYLTAYFSLLYDHAELFWLYNTIETDYLLTAPVVDMAPKGKHTVNVQLTQPYANYKEEMTAFNDAVEAFLSDIDRTASDEKIAKEIHDKLVDLVTYNMPVCESGTLYDLAHTAYGALVADSSGTPNYAVCDGYSQAYVYLLQQCGINATLIVGLAGNTRASAGGHAWSLVELDGEWYEVDSTWDDVNDLEMQAEEIKNSNPGTYVLYHDALSDPAYRELIKHYLFNVTTDEITSFQPTQKHFFVNKAQNRMYSLKGNSVHLRANPTMRGLSNYGLAVQMAPTATGTKYAFQ